MRVFRGQHAETPRLASDLSAIYQQQGRVVEAHATLEKAVTLRKNLLGDEHQDTLSTLEQLALSYQRLGELRKAEETMTKVIEDSVKVLGKEHPDTISRTDSLTSILESLNPELEL